MSDIARARSSNSEVLFSLENGIAQIIFNRPTALNSIDNAMARRLVEVADWLPEVEARIITLRGAGGNFMAGGDIATMAGVEDIVATTDFLISSAHKFSLALMNAQTPVLAIMEGAVAGYGLSLALSCDFSVCSRDARLSFAYRRLGTTCDGGPSYILPKIVGHTRAMALLLTENQLNPADAEAMGLLTKVVAAGDLDGAAANLIEDIKSNSSLATSAIKRLTRSDVALFALALEEERQSFLRAAAAPEFKTRLQSFLEMRKANRSTRVAT